LFPFQSGIHEKVLLDRISQPEAGKSGTSKKSQPVVGKLGSSLQLSWSHYIQLLKIDDESERNFYEIEAIQSNWGKRELIQVKNFMISNDSVVMHFLSSAASPLVY
jgi:hypothetical protein